MTEEMQNEQNLFRRIDDLYDTMSKGQKRLADYIREHYDKAVFMTAAHLGKQADVSESTALRFAAVLGYPGFAEFLAALRGYVAERLSDVKRMEAVNDGASREKIFDAVLCSDMENIRATREQLDREAFAQAVETILSARNVYVVGVRNCAPLAEFLAYYLHQIIPGAVSVTTNSASEVFEQMIRVGEGDAVIGISFPRYSMRTLRAMEFANHRNARVIAVTDSVNSPINLYSSCNLVARSTMASVVDSLTAALSVINALIVSLCMRRQEAVMETLETMERVWEEYQVFGTDEINSLDDRVDLAASGEDPDE